MPQEIGTPPAPPAADSMARALEEYLAAAEAGAAPPRAEFLARYPELADDLDACLAALRFIGRAADGPRSIAAEAAGAEPPEPPLGRLGDFRLIREVGRGGMGVVYEAEQMSLRRRVALKVLPFAALMDPRHLQRFHNEVRAAASLDHPHIVPVHAVGCERGVHHYAMQFIEGQTLAAMIADLGRAGDRPAGPGEQGTAPHVSGAPAAETAPRAAAPTEGMPRDRAYFRRVAEWGAQAAEALDHAHQLGIVHRDVKPANLLVDGRGGLWVTDFGLAHVHTDTRLTMTGDLVGTLRYMSPEQALAKRVVDYRTDVYSLGATLYELLTLEPVFGGGDRQELLQQIAFEEPARPRRRNRAVPVELETIVLKALEKDAAERYATAKELADDLRRFLADEPIRARPLGAWSRAVRWCRRHRARTGLVAAAGLALPVLAWAVWWHLGRLRAYEDDLLAWAGRERAIAAAADEERRRALDAAAEAERERSRRLQAYGDAVHRAADLQVHGYNQESVEALAGQFPDPGAEDLRGFEWHLLWQRVRGLRLLKGYRRPVTAVAFSPDGRTCTSASQDGSVRLWDTASGRPVPGWEVPGDPGPNALRFSADGSRLVLGAGGSGSRLRLGASAWDNPGVLKVWDVATAGVVAQRDSSGSESWATAVSPDGGTVAFTGGGKARLWDVASGDERVVWHGPTGSSGGGSAVCFAPGGRLLAVAYGLIPNPKESVRIDLVDLREDKVQATWRSGWYGLVDGLAFSPDGSTLAAGSFDGSVRLWDVTKRQETAMMWVRQPVFTVAFSPDGRTLAAGAAPYLSQLENHEWSVTLWDVASGAKLPPELRPRTVVLALAYAPDGRTLAVGCADEFVRLWEPEPCPEFLTLPGHQPSEAWAVAFTPDGKTLVSGGDDHAVRLWDVAAGRLRDVLLGHGSLVTCVAVSPDGKRIAAGDFDDVVKVWDVATRKVVFTGRQQAHVNRVAFSPDGKLLAASDRNRTVRVWDANTFAERATLTDHESSVTGLAFVGPRLLATGCDGGKVRLWDVDTWQSVQMMQDEMDVFCLTGSPDGKLLATGSKAGLVTLWETETGREVRVLRGHWRTYLPDKVLGGIRSVVFSPDGRTLASAGEDKTIRLWQVATGVELLSLKDQPHFINGVAFSPDGTYLAAALHDGSIRLWQAAAGN